MKALVIDSATRSQRLLGDILAQAQLQAALTSNSQHALTLLAQEPFDLLFLELDLPGVDGIGVLAHARRLQPALLAVIMAHQPSAEACVEAMRLGAVDCLFKPITTEKVVAALLRVSRTQRLAQMPLTPPNELVLSSGHMELRHDAAHLASDDRISLPLAGGLKQIQARLIHDVIRRFDGNKTAAAKALGMHRRTLYRLLAGSPPHPE